MLFLSKKIKGALLCLLFLAPFAMAKPVITTPSLPNSEMGKQYEERLEATEDAEWSVIEGGLPPGLRLSNSYSWDCSSGECTRIDYYYISGYPTKADTYNFKLLATNKLSGDSDPKDFRIIITPEQSAPIITDYYIYSNCETVGEYCEVEINANRVATSWKIASGSLPPGLELRQDTQRPYTYIRGYPTTTGTYNFTVVAANSKGNSAPLAITIKILQGEQDAPRIGYIDVPQQAKAGVQYRANFESYPAANWSISSGSLPQGLSIENRYSGDVYILGAPTTAGTYTFKVKATNTKGSDEAGPFTIVVETPQAAPAITTSTMPGGVLGEEYLKYFEATEDATWSITGNLPPGIDFYPEYGVIYGIPTTAGTYNFTVKAANAKGSDTKPLTINITTEPQAPKITSATLPKGEAGEWYSAILEATSTAVWSVVGGSRNLPPGLELRCYEVCEIGGRPTEAGTYNFTVRAVNAKGIDEKTLSITIESMKPPTITTASMPSGRTGVWYNGYIQATGYVSDWEITSGSLPDGLYLDYNYGSVYGRPTKTGTYNFTVRASNSEGSSVKSLTITIEEGPPPPPYITTDSWLYDGTWGEGYSQQLRAVGADTWEDITSKVKWSISSGSLPPGLVLNASSGIISGTPTGAGYYYFTIKAQNSADSDVKDFEIYIENVAPEILTTSVPEGEVGANYNVSLQSKGSVTWSITSGDLPSGLRLNTETGVISGIPTNIGTYTFTVEAYNYMGYDGATFTITIEAMKPPVITSTALAKGTVGSNYSERISSTSAVAVFSLKSGDLPSGLALASDGTVSGKPTTKGTYTFTVKATNDAGTGEKEFTLVVEEAPIVDDGSPILPQIAVAKGGNARAYAQGSAIVLENIPQNSKVEVYNLKGRQVYSGSSGNSETLRVQVQAKGMYVVKANKTAYRVSVR
ncbi:MAG: putative Ig domain-containing protein [Fibromonadaceae bacterium]|jgi:hypothetical protein|nr:putative Ig domain-containing protein [Fibromonadaceae bacterium]